MPIKLFARASSRFYDELFLISTTLPDLHFVPKTYSPQHQSSLQQQNFLPHIMSNTLARMFPTMYDRDIAFLLLGAVARPAMSEDTFVCFFFISILTLIFQSLPRPQNASAPIKKAASWPVPASLNTKIRRESQDEIWGSHNDTPSPVDSIYGPQNDSIHSQVSAGINIEQVKKPFGRLSVDPLDLSSVPKKIRVEFTALDWAGETIPTMAAEKSIIGMVSPKQGSRSSEDTVSDSSTPRRLSSGESSISDGQESRSLNEATVMPDEGEEEAMEN